MFRRNTCRLVSYREFAKTKYGGKANIMSPYNVKTFCLSGFVFTFIYIGKYSLEKTIEQGPVLPTDGSEIDGEMKRSTDGRRPPWPLLHQRVVMMREGKLGHDDLALSWEQCKYYYPQDWLIPLEIAQILKYSSPLYMQAYISEPDDLRKEVLSQLTKVRYNTKINRDEEEIIDMMLGELETMCLVVDRNNIPLVPSHNSKSQER